MRGFVDRFAVVARALVYATAFVWLVLVFLPARVLERAGLPLLAAHLFVVGYEEPKLRRVFGADYLGYCRRVGRWIPGRPTPGTLATNRRPSPVDPR